MIDKLETRLELLALTGVEDKLQVPAQLSTLVFIHVNTLFFLIAFRSVHNMISGDTAPADGAIATIGAGESFSDKVDVQETLETMRAYGAGYTTG